MALIRLATLLTACLTALGLTVACGNPNAEAWESLISKGKHVEKELEELQAEQLAFFGHNPEWSLPQCAKPTWERMLNEVSHVDLGDLSRELERWGEYAEALAKEGAGRDLLFTSRSHLVEIEVDYSLRD